MLKKAFSLITFILLAVASFAQKTSAANTKKLLTTHEWELKYYLENGERIEIPEGLKGLRVVFMPSKDLIYEYTRGSKDPINITKGVISAESFKFIDRIEEPEMIIDIDKLEKEGLLVINNEFESDRAYSVFEKTDKIKDKGYPVQKYELEKLEVPMQRIHPELEKMTKSLGAEIKKTTGNLFFFDKNKTRYLIKETYFEATEYGIKFSSVYDTNEEKNQSYSYEFMPEEIYEITDVKVDPSSRVGQIKIALKNETAFYRSPYNSSVNSSIKKTFNIEYFKESANSFEEIKEKFETLSQAYYYGRENRLEFLKPRLEKGRKIWLSQNGTSSDYQLARSYIAGNKIYLHYNISSVGLSSTKSGSYITIIPLKDITGLTVENTKSKPKTLLLHAKKGFETFGYSKDKYIPMSKVYVMPLFNYGEKGADLQRVEQTLRKLISDDGGDNIKTVYNP